MSLATEPGSLDVLNTGLGHLKLTFDQHDGVELDRAKRMVEQMLSAGYAIFVEVRGKLQRVQAFDPLKAEYVVTDVPGFEQIRPETPAPEPEPYSAPAATPTTCPRCHGPKHRGRCPTRRVPMKSAKATAVGRTAGG